MNEDERTRQQTTGSESDLIRSTPSIGAPLPPAQGGPSFSQTEMQVLAGGSPPVDQVQRFVPVRPDATQRRGQPAFDLDSVKKEVEESLSAIDTTAALEDARKELGTVLAPELDHPPLILKEEAERRSAAGDESWRLPPEEQAKWERRIAERRRQSAEAAKSAMSRSLSGGRATGKKITDDEAFGAEDALIVGSPDSVGDSQLPF